MIGDPLLLQSLHEEWDFGSTESITGAVSAVNMSPVFGDAWSSSLSKMVYAPEHRSLATFCRPVGFPED